MTRSPELPLQIVIPMAGDGQRFVDVGYKLPKPLIPIAGTPMVFRAIQDLPTAERVVLIIRQEHIDQFSIDKILHQQIPDARIVVAKTATAGQACTVALAADHLIPDLPVIVGACDSSNLFNVESHAAALADEQVEALVWTCRRHLPVALSPLQYGYARTNGTRIQEIRCKETISSNPHNDHVVTGFFTFRSASRMLKAIDETIGLKKTVRGEFYMDVVPNVLINRDLRVDVFEVEKYICWGTPLEYEDFRSWEKYFEQIQSRDSPRS